jgi:hypothetical protein
MKKYEAYSKMDPTLKKALLPRNQGKEVRRSIENFSSSTKKQGNSLRESHSVKKIINQHNQQSSARNNYFSPLEMRDAGLGIQTK